MENSNEKKNILCLIIGTITRKDYISEDSRGLFFEKLTIFAQVFFHIIIESTNFTASQSVEIEAKTPGDWKKVRRASAGFLRLVCTSLLKIYS